MDVFFFYINCDFCDEAGIIVRFNLRSILGYSGCHKIESKQGLNFYFLFKTVAVTPTTPLTTLMTTPVSIFGFKLPPSSEASEIVASVPNGVFMKAEVLIIIAFFIGFLTMFGIAVFAVFTVKYYRKKRKQKKLGSSSE